MNRKGEAVHGTDIPGIGSHRMDHSVAWGGKRRPVAHVDQRDACHERARAYPYEPFMGSDLLSIYPDHADRRLRDHAMACETLVQHVVYRVSASA